jgi:hypothetical protein
MKYFFGGRLCHTNYCSHYVVSNYSTIYEFVSVLLIFNEFVFMQFNDEFMWDYVILEIYG